MMSVQVTLSSCQHISRIILHTHYSKQDPVRAGSWPIHRLLLMSGCMEPPSRQAIAATHPAAPKTIHSHNILIVSTNGLCFYFATRQQTRQVLQPSICKAPATFKVEALQCREPCQVLQPSIRKTFAPCKLENL